MVSDDALTALLGAARFRTYLNAADGDRPLAIELYEWGVEVAGAWHSHICYIEVAARNAIDRELMKWNALQRDWNGRTFQPDWTADNGAAPLIYGIIGRPLRAARENATKEAHRRPHGHPRRGQHPNHDDIVAQLMFGAWTRLLMPPHRQHNQDRQKHLWRESLHRAFPKATSNDDGRQKVGHQLEAIRVLRNRIAHHDNLLHVDIASRLNGSLSLLATIQPDLPGLVMSRNSLRRLAREDPRHHHSRQ